MTDHSRKFVSSEDCARLAAAMNTKYRLALKGREFSVTANLEGEGVHVEVLFQNQDKSFFYPVEARMRYQSEDMKADEAALFFDRLYRYLLKNSS